MKFKHKYPRFFKNYDFYMKIVKRDDQLMVLGDQVMGMGYVTNEELIEEWLEKFPDKRYEIPAPEAVLIDEF